MASFGPVRAILRGLDVLRLLNEVGPASAKDLAKRARLPQPTVIRILETLIRAGYIHRIDESVLYGVTARTLALSRGFDATSRLVQLAKPAIENLRSETGWPSNLATFHRDAMTIAYTNRSAYGMSIPGRLGARLPLLATGVGTVYFANLVEEEREAILKLLKKSDSRWDTSPEILKTVERRVKAAKRDGYAFAEQSYLDEIYDSQIWAVAVPIMVDGKVVAGLSSLILHNAGPRKRILTQILPSLRRAAVLISERIADDAGRPGQDKAEVFTKARPARKYVRKTKKLV